MGNQRGLKYQDKFEEESLKYFIIKTLEIRVSVSKAGISAVK